MSESLFSRSWYRVAPLKPRLRSHVQMYKHMYRGEDWYVIQDRFTGRHHRFSAEAYQIIGFMDGERTLGAIWDQACKNMGDHMPTQDEVIGLLAQLYRSDLLHSSALANIADLEQRKTSGKRKRLLASVRSPMSMRLPLLDPDRFLSKSMSIVRHFMGVPALLVWIFTVFIASVLAVMHWPDLANNFTDQVLALENIFLVTLIYPVIKVLHEFGHAYMVKKWGGEVHEMGVIFLVFMPIPYVEASSSLAFEEKYKRMFVGAAGILIELFIASIALFVWLSVEPGPIRMAAFNIMLIAGVSTLLFNGNPLLRFDAYYVLADFLEIPNLGQKSSRYLGYLCQRYLLGIRGLDPLTTTVGESFWLFAYGIVSFFYRIFISFRIILFVAGKFFFVGLVLALWAAVGMIVMPISKMVVFAVKNHKMKSKRLRLFLVIILPILLFLGTVLFYPLPSYTVCEGVTWLPDESSLHATSSGFVKEILVDSGAWVTAGTPLIRFSNDELVMQKRLIKAKRDEFLAKYDLSRQRDINEAMLFKEALIQVEAELVEARQRVDELILSASDDGFFILEQSEDIRGRYYRRGANLGYILDPEKLYLRVVVPQADIENVRSDTVDIEVRLAGDLNAVSPAEVVREIPAGSRELPSLALSTLGGGPFGLDPREKQRPMVLENLFQFEVHVDQPLQAHVQERAYVRFEHSPEPISRRWYRSFRRLLLSHFGF
ncbi:MAG: peptidase M50 [Desulfotalea sp.]|nr:MAG: peptidase M50 [Desulfotalea sp.]